MKKSMTGLSRNANPLLMRVSQVSAPRTFPTFGRQYVAAPGVFAGLAGGPCPKPGNSAAGCPHGRPVGAADGRGWLLLDSWNSPRTSACGSVARTSTLLGAGFSDRGIRNAVAAGQIGRLRHGVVALPGAAPGHDGCGAGQRAAELCLGRHAPQTLAPARTGPRASALPARGAPGRRDPPRLRRAAGLPVARGRTDGYVAPRPAVPAGAGGRRRGRKCAAAGPDHPGLPAGKAAGKPERGARRSWTSWMARRTPQSRWSRGSLPGGGYPHRDPGGAAGHRRSWTSCWRASSSSRLDGASHLEPAAGEKGPAAEQCQHPGGLRGAPLRLPGRGPQPAEGRGRGAGRCSAAGVVR